jgi:hypothetical protein
MEIGSKGQQRRMVDNQENRLYSLLNWVESHQTGPPDTLMAGTYITV